MLAAQSHQVHDLELPGLKIEFSDNPALLHKVSQGKNSFAGLVEEGDKLYLMSMREMPEPKGVRVVTLRVEVNSEFLALIAPDLGAIQMNLTRKFEGGERQGPGPPDRSPESAPVDAAKEEDEECRGENQPAQQPSALAGHHASVVLTKSFPSNT